MKKAVFVIMLLLLIVNVQAAVVSDRTANSGNNQYYSPYKYYIRNAESYSDLDPNSAYTKSYYAGRSPENDYRYKYRYADFTLSEQRRIAKKLANGDASYRIAYPYLDRYYYTPYNDDYRSSYYRNSDYDPYFYGRSRYDSYFYGYGRNRYNDPKSTYYNRPYIVSYNVDTNSGTYSYGGSYNDASISYYYSNY
ncbi:MAG: hypothetical protein QW331_04215 [Candidatus Woesearchaeota archaeon]